VFITVAALPLIVPVKTEGNVCPASAVSVTEAVYIVLGANAVPPDGDHVTALAVKLPNAVNVVTLVAPVNGVAHL